MEFGGESKGKNHEGIMIYSPPNPKEKGLKTASR
jgi:hypothetical protein